MIPSNLCYLPGLLNYMYRTHNIPTCSFQTRSQFPNQDPRHTKFSNQIDASQHHSPAFSWLMTGITTGTTRIGSGGVQAYD